MAHHPTPIQPIKLPSKCDQLKRIEFVVISSLNMSCSSPFFASLSVASRASASGEILLPIAEAANPQQWEHVCNVAAAAAPRNCGDPREQRGGFGILRLESNGDPGETPAISRAACIVRQSRRTVDAAGKHREHFQGGGIDSVRAGQGQGSRRKCPRCSYGATTRASGRF